MESVNEYSTYNMLLVAGSHCKTFTNVFAMFMEVLRSVNRSTVGRCARRVTASETGKPELHDLPHSGRFITAVSPEMLQRVMPSSARSDPSQRDSWPSGFQSPKEMLVTPLESLDIRRYARGGFLGATQSNTKPTERPFLWSYWHVLYLRKKPSYAGLLQHMKPGSMILTRRQERNSGKAPSSVSPEEEIQTVSLSRQGHDHYLVNCEGVILVDATPRGETVNSGAYIRTLIELKKSFKPVRPRKIPTEILLQCHNARPHTSLTPREPTTKFGWKVLSHPPYSPDLAPSHFILFGALKNAIRRTKFSTDDVVIRAVRT
jgi:hypothetical protein